jgi:hypothetical protein
MTFCPTIEWKLQAGSRHARSKGEDFARTQRRQKSKQVCRGVRCSRLNKPLVPLICHPHRKDRAALRNDRLIDLRRTLSDELISFNYGPMATRLNCRPPDRNREERA